MSLEDELYNAIKEGDEPKVQFLLSLGVSVNVPNEEGYTPLHLAIIYENYKIMAKL